jgi:hypothetical protein
MPHNFEGPLMRRRTTSHPNRVVTQGALEQNINPSESRYRHAGQHERD